MSAFQCISCCFCEKFRVILCLRQPCPGLRHRYSVCASSFQSTAQGGRVNRWCTHSQTPRTFLLYANGLPFRPLPYGEGIIVKNLLFTFLRISYVCAKGGVPDIPAEKCHLRIPVFFSLLVSSIKPKKKTAHSENSFTLIDNTCSLH